MAKHVINPVSWRCERCGEAASACMTDPFCHPEPETPTDPFFGPPAAESYQPAPADVES